MSMLNQLAGGKGVRRISLGIALRIVAQIFAIAPFFIAWLALQNLALQQGGWDYWPQLTLALLLCFVAQLICSHFGQLGCFLGSYDMMLRYRQIVADHLRKIPLGYFQRHRLGETSALLTDHMRRVEEIFSHLLPEVIVGLSAPLIFVVVLLTINIPLTLALLCTLPLGLLLLWIMSRFMLRATRLQGDRFALASGLLLEFIGGIKTLRLFNRHQGMMQQIERNFAAIRQASMGIEAWGGGGVQLFRLCAELGLVALFICASALALDNALDPFTWLLFILVAFKVIDPLLDAAAWFTLMSVMRQSAQRLNALMAEPEQAEQSDIPLPPGNEIAFNHVSFAYEQQPVLKDVSFLLPEGSVTALVGASGSGKSTILHLLGRFWEAQQGEITLGGVAIAQLGSEQLYQRIGYVFQDVQLFDGSVLDNVRIGRPDASDEQVIKACEDACCASFVQQLPQGYHTPLGEGAGRLSGGERQRLSIARMMLKDPAVILLDEATALLDPLTQSEIQLALSRLAVGKTVLMIAHRLRTVEFAEQILLLDNGEIVARGTHQQLLAQPGMYRRLWQAQEGGDAPQ
ncbi:ABC transporter ATP-binding protein/permease [Erwiniaceae bacterium BAC15a-03b]|uniref:ABC-type xenobiotic transporter n=1 Tax=Winslowiella arboricola TaxID=2978220 RepID=A0A9J6PXT6_9GAMM|nr:ABC transporter ATP-binding protein [Winslowiella arboricola]MCU5775498.1 ABC transporter ATP-binding protein/permease [Winslowiella arboricola]MCU5779652.1 ABC transporter ATP-binding protein/permease [Winslowiella arboricola]